VDANAARHPISPLIYGINNWSDNGLQEMMRIPLVRWGGDDATSFNWQNSVKNNTGDNPWVYENYTVSPGFNSFHETNLRTGTTSLGTVSLMDWLPKAAGECSFSVKKYGPQKATNPDNSDCGNGHLESNGDPVNNDPNDAYVPVTPGFSQQWVQQLNTTYGPGNRGGVQFWSMDNEPEWWYGNHLDVYRQYSTYDDVLTRNIKWATAVKAIDPTALVTGPVPGGWSGMYFSFTDMQAGWNKSPYQYWDNPIDQNAHGGVPWIPYYLQKMQAASAAAGERLLDVVDVHAYIMPVCFNNNSCGANTEQLRMTSTREFWDPNYLPPGGGYEDATGAEQAPQLIPRLHGWVDNNYPGTMLGITEYSWGGLNTITGAIAQADLLGIFGRESLDLATLWGAPNPTDPGAFAFQMFLNYDGNGNRFGETSVWAVTGDPDTLDIFAAQRSDMALTILALNKTSAAITDSVIILDFTPDLTNAQAWQYSSANLNQIVKVTGATFGSGSVSATFPAYSMTLFVIPQSQSAMTVPKPVINWVKNAASWNASAIAPGEVVAIQGTSVGPAQQMFASSSSQLATSLGGVSVLFNGILGAMIYTTPISGNTQQLAAVVPYEIAANPATTTVNVQVEVQGNSSDPFPVPVTTALPGLFTNDYSGLGQAAALNQDTVNGQTVITRNGALNPAASPPTQPATRGSYILIYATGEGQTSPPGVDGRIATSIFPAPVLSCSVSIGGITVTPVSCGATPNSTAGELQVKAQVPMGVTPGNNVPVQVTIGNVNSQAGVTIAVQ
jgi:uncharacterized protein (TIGR03437 family)